jgi:chitodextrinase
VGRAQSTRIRLRAGGAIDSEESWEAAVPADTTGLGASPAGGELRAWTLRGLEPGTLYGLAVRAVDDSALMGGLSNPLTWTTPALPLEPPGPVRDLSSDAQEERRARVLWLAPLPGDTLAPAEIFVLARRAGPGLFETEEDWNDADHEEGSLPIPGAPEETLSYWIEGLAPATTYAVTLRARDEQGRLGALIPGIVLATAEADTVIDPPPPPPDLPPAPIGDLHVVGTGSDRALLAWTAVGEDSLTGTAAAYEMRVRVGGSIDTPGDWDAASPYDGALSVPRAAGSPESLQVTGLLPSTSYGFALRARDHAGQISPFAAGVLATTEAPPAELPLPVTDLAALAAGSGTIELRWSHDRDANAERGPARYQVGLATVPLVEVLWSLVDLHPEPPDPTAAGVAVELAWTGLEPATRYWVAVRAQDAEGRLSPLSNVVEVETQPLDLAPPEPPAHVWIAGTEPDGRLLLAWDPSASPDVAGYHVYGRTGEEPWERLTVEPLLPTVTRWSAPPENRALAVSALDTEGNESAPRASAEGALTKIDVRGPFPHPVRASCRFEVRIPVDRLDQRVRARIFDIDGEEIRVLLDEPAGHPLIDLPWDRRDGRGALAAPGFYLLRVEVGSSATHRRIYLDP